MDIKAKEMFEKVMENNRKLKSCSRHVFEQIPNTMKYRCSNCGAEASLSYVMSYKQGIEHILGSLECQKSKPTVVVSAFPGSGKSYCFSHYAEHFNMLDSDSSKFSWEYDKDGNKTGERNQAFPINYISHIKDNIGKVDIIFVSTHESVRKALEDFAIQTVQVFPTLSLKDVWLDRLEKRGSSEDFVKLIDTMWEDFLKDIAFTPTSYVREKMVLDENIPYITKEYLDILMKKRYDIGNTK